ncbi:hypothetical protein I3843_10G119600 [Carya illinoinensis]|nr:hypothetical protein I3843_10G119600 [Carya illinoinensis]
MELNLIRSKGKCSFAYIIASIRYWVIHSITVPLIFIASWLFINMGLAYDITGIKASKKQFTDLKDQWLSCAHCFLPLIQDCHLDYKV